MRVKLKALPKEVHSQQAEDYIEEPQPKSPQLPSTRVRSHAGPKKSVRSRNHKKNTVYRGDCATKPSISATRSRMEHRTLEPAQLGQLLVQDKPKPEEVDDYLV